MLLLATSPTRLTNPRLLVVLAFSPCKMGGESNRADLNGGQNCIARPLIVALKSVLHPMTWQAMSARPYAADGPKIQYLPTKAPPTKAPSRMSFGGGADRL